MSENDTIRLFGKHLYLQFATTGETSSVSTLPLGGGLQILKSGMELRAQKHGDAESFLIERFGTENLAQNAFKSVRGAVQKFVRRERWAGLVKNIVLWGVTPAIGLLFVLGINAAATRGLVTPSRGFVPGDASAPYALAPQPRAVQAPPPAVPRPAAAQIAKAMADGVAAGKFSVELSKGSHGTVYVFSDPNCSHCQDFEGQIDRLASDFTVQVFPVSVVGGKGSADRNAELLCTEPKGRPAGWKRLIAGDQVAKPATCDVGVQAANANDQIFHALGLPGTPSIITGDGRVVPETVQLTAEGLKAWMDANPVMASAGR